MARVYVSSTVADLQRERRAVMDRLVAAGHQPVHSYRPDSETVRDSCLDDVGTCDLYVLILGHRYGAQPLDGNPESLSITHLEFRRAGQSHIPRVALLRTSIPDVSVSDMGHPQKLTRVLAFQAEVAREVRTAEFADMGGLLQGLSTGVQAELAKRSAGAVGAARALRLAAPPGLLAGREDLFAGLDDRLAAGEGAGPRVVALHGLGGAGKTSVALAYAHRHRAEAGITWQLAAEDPAVLAAGFGELAAQLGVREGAGDPVAAVHAILAGYPAGWLLVFDNAPGPTTVARFLPPAGDGRVVITSRNALWPPGQAVEVPVLDLDAAAGFLAARTGDADHQAAAGLAEAVDGLPLALEQAAAYIQATGGSLAGYLAVFRRRRADLLARGEPAGYPGTVAATWVLAFTQVEEAAPAAAGLLRLLACCAPEAIPLRLLLQSRPGLADQFPAEVRPVLVPLLEDELAAGDAVAALRRYSLVRPAAGGAVSVHPLVQAVTADHMPDEPRDAWRRAAAALIGAAIPAEPWIAGTWPVYAMLLPHIQVAAPADSAAAAAIADYLGYSGSYRLARESMARVLEARERTHGPEHPGTLTARTMLAHWTAQAGEAATGRDQLAGLLPVAERVLGPEDPRTLFLRRELAWWTGDAGGVAAARDQWAELVPVCERALGPEHPETLTVRQGLAGATGMAGDAAAARDQSAAVVPVYLRVLGPEHTGTLGAQANLAGWTGQAGDPAAARRLFAEVLAVRERVFGAEHPETLRSRRDVATWTGEAGDAVAARDQLAALLPRYQRRLGPDHPYTLTTHAWLAGWTGDAGDPAQARDQYAALLPIRERVLGAEHPDTLSTRHSFARWTGHAGDAAGARDQFAALLPIQERVFGPEHPETLTTRAHLARWTGNAGDAAAARDQFAALLPLRERVLGPQHPATLTTRTGLAAWTGTAGNAAGARDEYAALLPIQERVLGPEHPDTLRTRNGLASWTGRAGDAAGARDQCEALLPLRERVLGSEHPDTLTTRNQLARWTGRTGDAAGARDQYTALLPLRERVSGSEHPDTLTTRAYLAHWTGEAGDAAGACDQFAALLPIQERLLGPGHPHTVATRTSLARWTERR
jgi:hypothetical protein